MSRAFYRVYNALSQSDIPPDAGDFRLIVSVVVALSDYRERNRFMKGLFSAVGFKTTHVPFETPARRVGATKWSYWRLWNFALDGIFSFSTVPIRIWTYVGALIAFFSLLYAVVIVVTTMISGLDVPGYASLITAILFMGGGVQLISLGIIGEYIARIFLETKQRPIYTIDLSRSVMERRPPSPRQSAAAQEGTRRFEAETAPGLASPGINCILALVAPQGALLSKLTVRHFVFTSPSLGRNCCLCDTLPIARGRRRTHVSQRQYPNREKS